MTVLGEDGLARPAWASVDPLLREYYDTEWGLPVRDERGLFERLSLEAFQSGLSWVTILRKRPAFRAAFDDFDPDTVAGYDERDVERLLGDTGIVRNRRKIEATIANARATVRLRDQGGLVDLVWSFRPAVTPAPTSYDEVPTRSEESAALSRKLHSLGFRFVGPTTMFALMEAVGIVDTHLVASHRRGSSGVWGLPLRSVAASSSSRQHRGAGDAERQDEPQLDRTHRDTQTAEDDDRHDGGDDRKHDPQHDAHPALPE